MNRAKPKAKLCMNVFQATKTNLVGIKTVILHFPLPKERYIVLGRLSVLICRKYVIICCQKRSKYVYPKKNLSFGATGCAGTGTAG
jgi:hypothetical protein